MNKKERTRKKNNWSRLRGNTNFYPTYFEGRNDKVTPTSAAFITAFQPVIPYYILSMSETRDNGTGPSFLETTYQTPKKSFAKKEKSTLNSKIFSNTNSKKVPDKKNKIRTDFWY